MTWDINKQVTTIIFQSYRLSNKAQNWREITRRQCTSTKPLKPEKHTTKHFNSYKSFVQAQISSLYDFVRDHHIKKFSD